MDDVVSLLDEKSTISDAYTLAQKRINQTLKQPSPETREELALAMELALSLRRRPAALTRWVEYGRLLVEGRV
jgi:hypothetical protein